MGEVSNLVFYTQSTITVISGHWHGWKCWAITGTLYSMSLVPIKPYSPPPRPLQKTPTKPYLPLLWCRKRDTVEAEVYAATARLFRGAGLQSVSNPRIDHGAGCFCLDLSRVVDHTHGVWALQPHEAFTMWPWTVWSSLLLSALPQESTLCMCPTKW